MGFSRQEYWSGLPCPSSGDLPNPGIEPQPPELQKILYHLNHQCSPYFFINSSKFGCLDGVTCITSAFSVKRDETPLSHFYSRVKARLAFFHPLALTEPTTTFLLFLWGTLSGRSGLDAAGTADGLCTSSFTSPFSRRCSTGHCIRKASHIHQFHQGDECGLLSQLVSTAEQNVVKTLSYTEKFDRF